ncbi:hypothetical protein [Brevundimonas sp.]|uniref:hypothetical protein n=1 Tax=Brevundimonas sp. TaxID=1871086 RepID=UPI002488031D|nr:hypothetical protein [Brevundimonas sp.]MDI1282454.1 hypothetical protein [Brevundimonas sp.]
MRRLTILVAMCLTFVLAGSPATAAVTVTFYAHSGNKIRGGWLLFPHAYVTLTGTVDATGEVVDEAVGFTAKFPGPQLLLFSGAGVVERPDALYLSEGRAYLTLRLSDAVYEAVMARIAHWSSPEGSTYSLWRRNCINFIADIARAAGLMTADEDTLSPNGFMTGTAALNPAAAVIPVEADPTRRETPADAGVTAERGR